MASVDAGHDQETELVNEIGFEKGAINMTASFEQEPADAEVLAQQSDRLYEIDRLFSRNDVRDVSMTQEGQVVFRRLLADDADQMIAVEIAPGPGQLTERVD